MKKKAPITGHHLASAMDDFLAGLSEDADTRSAVVEDRLAALEHEYSVLSAMQDRIAQLAPPSR